VILKPEPLTRDAFQVFGDVLELAGRTPRPINQGLTLKFERLARLEVDAAGKLQMCVYRGEPVPLPFKLRELERHPLASQAFVPLHPRPFPVVVAAGRDRPSVADLRLFLTNGRQGVHLAPGVWHHHLLTLDRESDFLVLEREHGQGNQQTCALEGEAILQF